MDAMHEVIFTGRCLIIMQWAEGYSMKFGLYEVNFKTQERLLRDGAQSYIDVVKRTYAEI